MSLVLLLEQKLREWILEDAPYGDITTQSLFSNKWIRGEVVVLEDCVTACVSPLAKVLERLGFEVVHYVQDGVRVNDGTPILCFQGPADMVLLYERVILNFLMVMCGIATKTRRIVEKVRQVNPKVRVAATRKTHPGLQVFEKYAVQVGGGDTHRFCLSDMVLIKRNHIKLYGSISDAIKIIRARTSFSKKIEVEVTSPQEAVEAARAGADIVMLDNFTLEMVDETIDLLKMEGLRSRVLIEVSGGINEDNVMDFAKRDVDIISMSDITLKARPIDMRFIVTLPAKS